MTNLQELFEVFKGKPLTPMFDFTRELFHQCRRDRFFDFDQEVRPIQELFTLIKLDSSPYRIVYGNESLSLPVIQEACRSGAITIHLLTISSIKSEMMACATLENFMKVKELYSWWEDLEISLREISK